MTNDENRSGYVKAHIYNIVLIVVDKVRLGKVRLALVTEVDYLWID